MLVVWNALRTANEAKDFSVFPLLGFKVQCHKVRWRECSFTCTNCGMPLRYAFVTGARTGCDYQTVFLRNPVFTHSWYYLLRKKIIMTLFCLNKRSLSWARLIHSTPEHSVFVRSILICQNDRGSIPGRGWFFFFSLPPRSYWLWGPPISHPTSIGGSFPVGKVSCLIVR